MKCTLYKHDNEYSYLVIFHPILYEINKISSAFQIQNVKPVEAYDDLECFVMVITIETY